MPFYPQDILTDASPSHCSRWVYDDCAISADVLFFFNNLLFLMHEIKTQADQAGI